MKERELYHQLLNDKTSDGTIIARGVDYYHLSLEELLDLSKKVGLEPTSIIEHLDAKEQDGVFADDAIKELIDAADSLREVNKQERFDNYMAKSNNGFLPAFEKSIEESGKAEYIRTCFHGFDAVIEGGLHEGLYVVGAIPSLGKTTWVTQICDGVAYWGNDVIFVSLEMSRFDLMARSISRLTVYKYPQLGDHYESDNKTARGILDGRRYANYTERDRKVIAFAENEYAKFADRIHVIEGEGYVGVRDIRKFVEDHIEATNRIPVVAVDYLQLLAPYDPRASDKQNTDKNTLELRRIARDYHCPLLVVSSFNRTNYNTKVSFQSFKESGAIEYCADVVVGMQLEGVGNADFDVDLAKQENPRKVEAVILKNRFGQTGGTLKYQYHPAFNYFKEVKENKFL